MEFESHFLRLPDGLREEGRYRVFADLARKAGAFPKATPLSGIREVISDVERRHSRGAEIATLGG
jgi:hypothetical protein